MTEKSPFRDNYRIPKRLSEQEVEEPEKKKVKKKAVLYVRKKTN